jgi:hypothetical protein
VAEIGSTTVKLSLDHEDFEKALDRLHRKVDRLITKLEHLRDLAEEIDNRG